MDIDRLAVQRPAFDDRVDNWTFQECARLPWNIQRSREETALADLAGATVERSGDIVRFSRVTTDVPAWMKLKDFRNEMTVEFDLKYGGMIRAYSQTDQRRMSDGRLRVVDERWSMEWTYDKDAIVPKSRKIHSKATMDGVPTMEREMRLEFVQFTLSPVSAEEFDITRMRIPVGTAVVDHLVGMEYGYGTDDIPEAARASAVGANSAQSAARPSISMAQGRNATPPSLSRNLA